MKKYAKQFRYYGENHPDNYPINLSFAKLRSGDIFKDYSPMVQLGIQSEPGFKFYINDSVHPMMLGSTGIYELDLDRIGGCIFTLFFDGDSLNEIVAYNNKEEKIDKAKKLIIDIVYEGGQM